MTTPATPSRVGRYVIVDNLGQGGMGVVYRAWDPQLQRTVALKMLASPGGLPHHADVLERFAREARSAASLAHPHIVTVHDVGQHAGLPYITMEFLDGESMAQIIAREAALTIGQKIRLALDLCDGLAFAHARGIIHRDIKPANLMITGSGALKILDFGLARLAGELSQLGLTQTGAVMGTLHYMAPEQASGQLADARSDIFAVGAVLYELFTYRRAFDSDVPSHVFYQILHDAPSPMRDLLPDLPDGLDTAVEKALAKDPDARYQHLNDLAADLRAVARSAAIGDVDDVVARWTPASVATEPQSATSDSAMGQALKHWGAFVGDALAEPTREEDRTVSGDDASALEAQTGKLPSVPSAPMASAERASVPVSKSGGTALRRFRTVEIVAVAAALVAVAIYIAFYVTSRRNEVAPAAAVSTPAPKDLTLAAESAPPPSASVAPRLEERPAPPESVVAPRTPVSSPARAGAARTPAVNARCTDLLERVGLGEELSASDREFLSQQCRNGGR